MHQGFTGKPFFSACVLFRTSSFQLLQTWLHARHSTVIIKTRHQSSLHGIAYCVHLIPVCGALERCEGMFLSEWCQVIQSHIFHRRGYSSDLRFKICRLVVSITPHECVLHQSRAKSFPLFKRVDAHERQIPMRLAGVIVTHLVK